MTHYIVLDLDFVVYRDQLLIHVQHYPSLVITFMLLLQVEMKILMKEFIQATTLMTC